MSAEVWLVVATVFMVGGIIVWFIRRSTSGAVKTQVQALEVEASHLKEENANLEKRLAVEEQKASAIFLSSRPGVASSCKLGMLLQP